MKVNVFALLKFMNVKNFVNIKIFVDVDAWKSVQKKLDMMGNIYVKINLKNINVKKIVL